MRQHAGSELCEEIADDAAVQRPRRGLAYESPARELTTVHVIFAELFVLRQREALPITL